jgi:hypothetical protein
MEVINSRVEWFTAPDPLRATFPYARVQGKEKARSPKQTGSRKLNEMQSTSSAPMSPSPP